MFDAKTDPSPGAPPPSAGLPPPVLASLYHDAEAQPWIETETPGFWIKPLLDDPEHGESTLLMKVDAGAYAGAHAHDQQEQVLVLSGSFYDQNGTIRAGGFIVRPAFEDHIAGSEEGAVVLLVYSKRRPTA
ncbi:cupin domain-containing protein [Zavarzinia sp. CC-PAN008]|uniref:cupin domain-containing protein n=1 Tax=Zavarzinia sp. CC-PAN008 TaxID=3243332 RepID=UPI003F745360